jgi:hypothetical protein
LLVVLSACLLGVSFVLLSPSKISTNTILHIPKTKRVSERGIYITAWVAQTPKRFNFLKNEAKRAGINTVVVDAKEIISRPLLELVKTRKLNAGTKLEPDPWLVKLTEDLHKDGFIVSARIVTFKDGHLVIARPDLSIQMRGGGIYRDRKGGRWADPYADEVRLYNELIAERAAISGADEVQFDYIRFPAEGRAKDALYPHEKEGVTKVDAICLFLEGVKKRVAKYNVSIAVDIFGVTAWQSKDDIKNLGQDLKRMAKYIDVISPMLYPSHFHRGYDGFANPGSEPYYFINAGVKKTKEILSGEAVTIVPWIQGFDMRSPNFGTGYILSQVKACTDEKVTGFLVWNAGNRYDVTFSALRK